MSNHEEFPELPPEAQAAYDAAIGVLQNSKATITISIGDLRRALAACLREAMKQATVGKVWTWLTIREGLNIIANNLHNPPPPPPTLAEARAADLSTPEGQATARAFLANLAAETQP